MYQLFHLLLIQEELGKGTISVIGPTRMPYKKVVSLVEYITENIERIIKENDE